MSMQTDSLEQQAEAHRTRVDSTLGELRDRLSVGQIVDEVWSNLSDGQASDAVKNIGRQVRDHPLALALIGAGVAWLLAGEGVRAEGKAVKRRYDEWKDDGQGADYPGYHPKGYQPQPYSGIRTAPRDFANGYDTAGQDSADGGSDGSGLLDKTMDAVSELSDGATDAAGRAGEAISDAADAVGERARSYGAGISDAARNAGEEAARYGRYARRDLYVRGARLRRSFLDTLQEEPLIMGGLALAVGAAIGVSLPATRREDELLGPTRDEVRDAAYEYGADVAERAGNVAEKAYEAGSEEAGKSGLLPDGDSETVAEKVSNIASAAVDTAKDEAKKEGLS